MIDYIILLVAGFIVGILASLFGLGGGLIVVPTLLIILPFFHVANAVVVHVAIGTSLAIMFINSINSARSHHLAGNVKWNYFRKLIIYIALGTLIGTFIAYLLPASILLLAFVVFLLFIIIRFLRHLKVKNDDEAVESEDKATLPPLYQRAPYGLLAGIISACIGIGCSVTMTPFLKKFGVKIKNAAAIAATMNVFIALVASLSYAFLGRHAVDLPKYSTGFIFWPAFIAILIGSFVGVPVGTRLASKLSERWATILFFLFLIIIFIVMLSKYITIL